MTTSALHPKTTHPTEAALTRLLPRLQNRARFMTGDPDLAQDLAQDVVVKLWRQIRQGRQIDDLDAYGMTALRHLVASRWRARVVHEPLDDEETTVAPVALARISLAETQAAIDRLPQDQAHLMRLLLAGTTSPKELARATGLPTGTVMSRLARARARLRAELNLPAENAIAALM